MGAASPILPAASITQAIKYKRKTSTRLEEEGDVLS